MYTLRNRMTEHIPIGCNDVATREELIEGFRQYICSENRAYFQIKKWAQECSDDELLTEAYNMGYDEYEDREAMKTMKTMEEDYSDYPKSEWKEDAEQFSKLAVKMGLLSGSCAFIEDTDPAEYEEQQFGDWATNTIQVLAANNLESHLINF